MEADSLMDVLMTIYTRPRSLQSNFARHHSYAIARLASLGLITTAVGETFTHNWRLTLKGLRVLELGEHIDDDELTPE